MKLQIRNLARVHEASIDINGITVVAGYNSTGKSTISKAFVACLQAYSQMAVQISNQRFINMVRTIQDITLEALPSTMLIGRDDGVEELSKKIIELPSYMPSKDDFISALEGELDEHEHKILLSYLDNNFDAIIKEIEKKKAVSNQEYASFIVTRKFREIFDQQINTFGSHEISTVDFSGEKENIHIEISDNRASICPVLNLKEKPPIYIEPRHILDESASRHIFSIRSSSSFYRELIDDESNRASLTLDQYNQREHASNIVKALASDVMHGHLQPHDNTVSFYDDDFQEDVSVRNVASGIKSMALIARLVENGHLPLHGLLVIDEPEVNLHPAWQLKFANFLVLLNKELDIQILLTTHSPYFLKAIETYSKHYDNFKELKLYVTEQVTSEKQHKMYTVKDVTNDSNVIFKQLYLPLEEIL